MKHGVYRVINAASEHTDALDHLDLHRLKSINALINCHEGRLGAAIQGCNDCGKQSQVALSCRNRSCPRCQINASLQWLEKQRCCVLDTRYFHTVFTVPHCLNAVVRQNPKQCLGALFDAVSETLITFAKNNLNATIRITAVLHTWGQRLCEHYHLHCIVTAGGIANDCQQWLEVPGRRLFSVKALSQVFRAKDLGKLQTLDKRNKLSFYGNALEFSGQAQFCKLLQQAARKTWVVYAKQPFAGPDQVLKYLSLYTHRCGIGDGRILGIDENDKSVKIAYKDYADAGKTKQCRLGLKEFVRRFALHILPSRFVKIRHYGLLCNRYRSVLIEKARRLIAQIRPPQSTTVTSQSDKNQPTEMPCCPWCGGFDLVHIEVRRQPCSLPSLIYLAPDTS